MKYTGVAPSGVLLRRKPIGTLSIALLFRANMPNPNAPAPGVPYYTPAQNPPAGTALDPQPDEKLIPKLFQALQIRGVQFQNRIFVCHALVPLEI